MEADPNPLLDIREVLLPGFKQDRDIRFSRQGMRFLAVCDYQDNFSQLISEYEGDVTDDKSPRNDNIEPELIPVPVCFQLPTCIIFCCCDLLVVYLSTFVLHAVVKFKRN